MRHLLIALVIALLPLRAWVGDAMAITMQMPPAQEAVSMATTDTTPCEHAKGESDTSTMDHQHASCEVCHGPAMAPAVQTPLLPAAVHGVLATPSERFTSSVPQPGIKPPIS